MRTWHFWGWRREPCLSASGACKCARSPSRMMSTLKELEAQSSETRAIAFQHLLLLVGLHLFKVL